MNYLPFGRHDKPLDEVSDLINRDRIPTDGHIRAKLGEGQVEDAFWATFAVVYKVPQKSGKPVARHDYDLVKRPEVRGKFIVAQLEKIVGIPHDFPEDILIPAHGETPTSGIRPIVAAYVALDILGDILGTDIAYGLPYPSTNGQRDTSKRYGGILGETNFDELITKPVLKNPQFSAPRDKPKYSKEVDNGVEYATLTPYGREVFMSFLDRIYRTFSIREEEVKKAYQFVRERYQRFVDVHLPYSGLTTEAQREIAGRFVNKFISVIDGKLRQGNIYMPKSLREIVMHHYFDVKSLINSGKQQPADLNLILTSESPHVITLQKTLYWHYISKMMRDVIEVARRALETGTIETEPYLHQFMVKAMDLIDTTAGMGPNLDNKTSIHRKVRLFLREGVRTLAALNQIETPLDNRVRAYDALHYSNRMLQFKVRKELKDSRGEIDTMFYPDTEVFVTMTQKIKDLDSIVQVGNPRPRKLIPEWITSVASYL